MKSETCISGPCRVVGLAGLIVLAGNLVPAIDYDIDQLVPYIDRVDLPAREYAIGAGDLTGDGVPDVLIRANPLWMATLTNSPVPNFPRAYPLLTTRTLDVFDMEGVGDLNLDGFDDLAFMGTQAPDETEFGPPTGTYVLFGGPGLYPTPEARDIAMDSDDRGFHISEAGSALSSTGDQNGDGRREILVSSSVKNRVWVIFGKGDGVAIDAAALEVSGSGKGYAILSGGDDSFGDGVAGLMDFNGDGIDDIVVGSGEDSYIVYGKSDDAPVLISEIAAGNTEAGFRVAEGNLPLATAGARVASAGDVNGDGLGDVLIGSRNHVGTEEGAIHLLFGSGQNSNITIGEGIATGRILKLNAFADGPWMPEGLGDVDGDGFADFAPTQHLEFSPGFPPSLPSQLAVFYGHPSIASHVDSETHTLDESLIDRFLDFQTLDLGAEAYATGDLNGDGMTEFSMSRDDQDFFVFLNPYSPPASATYRRYVRPGTTSPEPVGHKGDALDTVPYSRLWVGFGGGDTSLVEVDLLRDPPNELLSGLDTPIAWNISTDRTDWSAADLKFKFTRAEYEAAEGDDEITLFKSLSEAGPWTPIDETEYDPQQRTIAITSDSLGYFALAARNLPPAISISEPSVGETSAGPVSWQVIYATTDAVDLQESDVVLNTTGTATGDVIVANGNSFAPTVTVSNITGAGTVGISILPGTGMDFDGTIDEGAGPSQTTSICAIAVAPHFITFNDEFTPFDALVSVDASTASCFWSAATTTPWISFVGPMVGTGDANLTIRVESNTGQTRFGSVQIGQSVVQVRQMASTPGVDTLGLEAPAGFSDVSSPVVVKAGKAVQGAVEIDDPKSGHTFELDISSLSVDSNGLVGGLVDGTLRDSGGAVVETRSIPVTGKASYAAKESIHMVATDFFGGYMTTGTVDTKNKLAVKGGSGDKTWKFALKGTDRSTHPPYSPPESGTPVASFDAKIAASVKKLAKAKGEIELTNWRTENAEVGFDRSTTTPQDSFGRKWLGASVLYSPFHGAPVGGGSASMNVKFADAAKGKLGKASISAQADNVKVKAGGIVVGTQPGSVSGLRPDQIPIRMTKLSMTSPAAKTTRKITWDQSLLLFE